MIGSVDEKARKTQGKTPKTSLAVAESAPKNTPIFGEYFSADQTCKSPGTRHPPPPPTPPPTTSHTDSQRFKKRFPSKRPKEFHPPTIPLNTQKSKNKNPFHTSRARLPHVGLFSKPKYPQEQELQRPQKKRCVHTSGAWLVFTSVSFVLRPRARAKLERWSGCSNGRRP